MSRGPRSSSSDDQPSKAFASMNRERQHSRPNGHHSAQDHPHRIPKRHRKMQTPQRRQLLLRHEHERQVDRERDAADERGEDRGDEDGDGEGVAGEDERGEDRGDEDCDGEGVAGEDERGEEGEARGDGVQHEDDDQRLFDDGDDSGGDVHCGGEICGHLVSEHRPETFPGIGCRGRWIEGARRHQMSKD
jgi:hypothetical protein